MSKEQESIAQAVLQGLTKSPKQLPPFLFYDELGSILFEQITELPEYYLTRAEKEIFTHKGRDLISAARTLIGEPMDVLELGAGTSTKTQLLLRELASQQGPTLFFPTDVSLSVLQEGARRIERQEPRVRVQPIYGTHEEVLKKAKERESPKLVLFIGSSIGNYDEPEAVQLLSMVRESLPHGGALVLGTDLIKSPKVLVQAYDDEQGITARFNKNVLTRINRELGGHFDLSRFRHLALWNEKASRIEMHLESVGEQSVKIEALSLEVPFHAGERIHTESSHKYDVVQVDSLLEKSGFRREKSFLDEKKRFAVHLAGLTG